MPTELDPKSIKTVSNAESKTVSTPPGVSGLGATAVPSSPLDRLLNFGRSIANNFAQLTNTG